jgi:hypothetical protein
MATRVTTCYQSRGREVASWSSTSSVDLLLLLSHTHTHTHLTAYTHLQTTCFPPAHTCFSSFDKKREGPFAPPFIYADVIESLEIKNSK